MRVDPQPTASIPPKPGAIDPIKPVLVRTLSFKGGAMQTASLAPLPSAARAPAPAPAPVAEAAPPPPAPRPGVLGTLPVSAAPAAAAGDHSRASTIPASARVRGGWLIQVGAFDVESDAKLRLSSAQSRARAILSGADPYTERVVKGDKAMYRARFAGLGKEQAEAACRYLKRNDIACMALKN